MKGSGKRDGDKRSLKEILGSHEKLLEDELLKVIESEENEGGEKRFEKGKMGSIATGFFQAMVEDCVKTTLDGKVEKLLEQNDALKVQNKRMKDALKRIEIQVEVADQEVTTAMKELEERGSQVSKLSAWRLPWRDLFPSTILRRLSRGSPKLSACRSFSSL